MDLLVLGLVLLFPVLDNLSMELFASSAVHGVHGHRLLELFELLFNLSALGLLLVEFVLELASHTIVAILSLFQVVADLVNVGKSVEVLVLVQHLVSVLLEVTVAARVNQDDLLLALFVGLFELLVLTALIFDSLDEFTLHGRLTWEVADAAIVLLI